MRIGLDFRFLSLGRADLSRGIPRFTQEQLQSVLALDAGNLYLLLCDSGVDLGGLRPEIRDAPNVRVVFTPEDAVPRTDQPAELASFASYQRWLTTLHLDLYHATCPVWYDGVSIPGFDVCPCVATAYDLIPLLYPAHYLPTPAIAEWYEQRLVCLEQATRIAAISQSTADDLGAHLGVPADRVDITPPAVSSAFRPLPADVVRSVLATLDHPARRAMRRRVRIPEQFVMCIAGMHYTKNTPTLLEAYAGLSTETRAAFPLVVAGALGSDDAAALRRMAQQLSIDDALILTGPVSDPELAALYNGAAVMVHPSHYEGFGLPVAEAMRSGTPVITTTRSALREVGGDAAMLVDSEDPAAFTHALDLLLHDSALRDDLSCRGQRHAARFDAATLGRATLDCYRAAVSTPQPPELNAVRVAIWSPVPPQRSGISEYTDDLVTALVAEPDLQLHLFVDDAVLPSPHLSRTARLHHWSDFERCAAQRPFDAIVYQLGTSPFHMYMERAMLGHPGIVVLHEPQWSNVVRFERLRHPDGEERFRRELVALEGDAAGRRWERIRALPWHARTDAERSFFDDHQMLTPVLDAATCCVTTTGELALDLAGRYPNSSAPRVISMGVRDPLSSGRRFDRASARAYLGLDPDAFTVVVPGVVDPAKHVGTVLDAVADLRQAGIDARVAVVGWAPDPAYEAALRTRSLRLGLRDAVRLTGHVPRVVFDAYLAASDVVVVLRDPRLRQLSAAVMRALAAGRCAVISDVAALRSIPDEACLRVASGPREQADVTEALTSLALDAERRRVLERAARGCYEATARIEPMAGAYATLIRDHAGRDRPRRTPRAITPAVIRRVARPAPRATPLPYSKVCEIEDFSHPALRQVIRDVCSHKPPVFGPDFPRGYEYRKDWEVAMAVRTLSDQGVLRPDARVLGVAAGTEDTIFYLTRHVGEVVAVDRYLEPGEWTETAPSAMLVDPRRLAPFESDAGRLTARHMDARVLDFPDESFDGIFSSGSIEHFGDLSTIAAAAYEMGRVLKPGGVLTLSTEILLTRDPGGAGVAFPGTLLLSPAELQRYIVDASGLESIDQLDLSVSHWTRSTRRDITEAINARHARMEAQTDGDRHPDWTCLDWPHIVVEVGGRQFTSVHLALRRAPAHPASDNAWARPTPALRADVARSAATATPRSARPAGATHAGTHAAVDALLDEARTISRSRAAADERLAVLDAEIEAGATALGADLRAASMPHAGVYRMAVHAGTVDPSPPGQDGGAVDPSPAPESQLPAARAIAFPIASAVAPPFTVVVDGNAHDGITKAYLDGLGPAVNSRLIALVLALVPPGGTFLDLGANVGSISLPVAAAGRHVLSVEAASSNVSLLEAGIELSGVADRVRVFPTAVGDRVGVASFVPCGPHGQLVEPDAEGAIGVPVTTVDALLESSGCTRVDLVKIDVEGAEVDVLRGMPKLARGDLAPRLLVECCPHTLAAYGRTTVDLISLLEEYGYVVYNVDGNRLMRRHPEEVQVTTVVDVLAAKRGVHHLGGWRVEPPMDQLEIIERLIVETSQPNADCRASVAREARSLTGAILRVPQVRTALASLCEDPEPAVRAAAAWWRDRARSGASA